jgi:hypothetical protein
MPRLSCQGGFGEEIWEEEVWGVGMCFCSRRERTERGRRKVTDVSLELTRINKYFGSGAYGSLPVW